RQSEAGAARARLDGWTELEPKIRGSACPFLQVPCPHERGKDLLGVVRDGASAERARVEAADRALEAARGEHAALRVSRERLLAAQKAHDSWHVIAAQASHRAGSWIESWDRERASLDGGGEPPDAFRGLVQIPESTAPAGSAGEPELDVLA